MSLLRWWHFFKNGDLPPFSALCHLFNNYFLNYHCLCERECQFEGNLNGMTTKALVCLNIILEGGDGFHGLLCPVEGNEKFGASYFTVLPEGGL